MISCIHQTVKRVYPPPPPRDAPEHKGIDPELQPFVDDYIDRAKAAGIEFKHSVTVGFKTINRGPVIGSCLRDDNFHEIDIDESFWEEATFRRQRALIFHELTHCLCNRNHDYAKGKDYPSDLIETIIDSIVNRVPFRVRINPGYFVDECGLTYMTPVIPSVECLIDHEKEYLREMFDRCEPY